MQTVFTELSDNAEILNNSQKIRLILQKVQNLILTKIKVSLQVSYDLDQANTVKHDFILNSLVAEAARIGDHNPREVADINTCGKNVPESGVKGSGDAILTRFYPYWSKLLDLEKQSIFYNREWLNIKGGGKSKSSDKKNRSGMHPSSPKK